MKRMTIGLLGAVLLLGATTAGAEEKAVKPKMKKANAEWLYRARWGVFTHYLADSAGDGRHASLVSPEEWNSRIDGFDVAGLARQLADIRASSRGRSFMF